MLIALYEAGTPFAPVVEDFGDPQVGRVVPQALAGRQDAGAARCRRDQTVPELSIIIEYLGQHYPRGTALIPADDPALALRTRLADRFYDNYVHDPMQRIVGDRLRPADSKDPFGVAAAEAMLVKSYDLIDAEMAGRTWASATSSPWRIARLAPPLFFASKLVPFGERHNLGPTSGGSAAGSRSPAPSTRPAVPEVLPGLTRPRTSCCRWRASRGCPG